MYDIIVVGGGHAGIEAALACARLKLKTLLVTLKIEDIGKMPCNPSIGGPAKGVVVREIDALGGQMGITADKTALQFKMLNMSKGPGVQCLRVQSDKIAYKKMMMETCLAQENLDVIEDMVTSIEVENKKITGITLHEEKFVPSKAVILTTGTYMSALVMVSDHVTPEGPEHAPTTNKLSESLERNGLKLVRLKTGTPARIKTNTIDFSKTSKEVGTDEFYSFSTTTKEIRPFDQQLPCYLTYTNAETHKLILDNLHRSSMYSGVVKGVGPRYCPSIEDKLVRFKDKERHQLFLEPESESLDTTYLQGLSTSLPYDVQEKMVHSIVGLENCVIDKYAYAIEYDAIDPLQLKLNFENKIIENLFCAGQINGTSGYEEAAGQGLLAGINAYLKVTGQEPLVLRRDEAYMGVLVDDLCTKGTNEPYRLLTSRAEFRLLLRHDNAEDRLIKYGYDIGLVSEERYQAYLEKDRIKNEIKEKLQAIRFTPKSPVNEYLKESGLDTLNDGISALELIARPHVKINDIEKYLGFEIDKEIARKIEIETKYAGYINKELKEAKRLSQMDLVKIPNDIDYNDIMHLAIEARTKLIKYRPETIGQASRISGINPSDIQMLALYLKQKKEKRNEN